MFLTLFSLEVSPPSSLPVTWPCIRTLPAASPSHQHPGYTAGWRGPLFGTAPHQACLKPVKLVIMMPGRLPFPSPPITQVNKHQAPAGPLGAGSALTPSANPQNRLQHRQDCSASRSSVRLTCSGHKCLFRTHHSRLSRTSSLLLPSTQNAANKAQRGSPRSPATQCQ